MTCQVELGQRVPFGAVEFGEVANLAARVEVDLHGPAGREGHEGDPVVVLPDDPGAVRDLTGEHILEQVGVVGGTVGPHGSDGGGRLRRHEGICVDLSVRVRKRDPDLHTAVLEAEDLFHSGQRRQCRGAIRPRLDHGQHPTGRQRRQGCVVVGGEADHLAAPGADAGVEEAAARGGCAGARERREAVLEDHHIVVRGGDLARVRRRGRAQRAGIGRRVIDPGLPVAGDAHPLTQQHVEPHLRSRDDRGQVALIHPHAVCIGVSRRSR